MSQAGMAGTASGGGSRIITTLTTFAPNATLQEFDDFLAEFRSAANESPYGKLAWKSVSGLPWSSAGTIDNPGILACPTGASDTGIYLSGRDIATTDVGPLTLGGGTLTVSWVINLGTLSSGGNTYRFSAGLADVATLEADSDSFVDGVYFQYTDTVNGGQWQLKATNSSATTTVNTATAAATGFVTLSISVNAAASSVSYYIDGVLVGSAITTNIPTASITPFFYGHVLSGNIPSLQVDLFWIQNILSNPRPGLPASSTILGTGMLILQYRQTGVSTQILNTDAIVGVSSTAAPRTLTMPASSLVTGQRWTFKDESGGAAANNITINGNGKNIDGAATYVINTNFGAVDIYYSGSNFFIV